MSRRSSRREFLNLTGAGIAALAGGAWPRIARGRRRARRRSRRLQRQGLHGRFPRAEGGGVRGQGRPVHRRGKQRGHQGAHRQGNPDVRRPADDDRAGIHRLPQSRAGQRLALRGAGRQSLRGGVRDDLQHRRQTARESPRDTAGHLGGRLFLRRHQGEGQSPARTFTTSTRCRRTTRSWSIIAAATRRSTTARPSRWRTSTRTRPIRRAGPSTATPTATSTAGLPTGRRAAFNRAGKRQNFYRRQRLQRDRDGLAYISKQFVRYGVTSVHHEGGNLFALAAGAGARRPPAPGEL